MLSRVPLLACLALLLTACSSERKTITFAPGDKAPVDKLIYSVVDTEILPRLGDDANPRMPQNRFYVVHLSIFNSNSSEAAIPGMTLIADSGKTYEELTDGTGVPRWLGLVRKVPANQTEVGSIVFDAPVGHYKVKLTDDTSESDVFVDLPLSFAHEQMQNETQSASEAVTLSGAAAPATPSVVPAPKKK